MRHRLWIAVYVAFFASVGLTVFRGSVSPQMTLVSTASAEDESADSSDSGNRNFAAQAINLEEEPNEANLP